MIWYERLKYLRASRNYTQKELADKSGLSQGFISMIERGLKNFTQLDLDKILGALDYTYHDLFCEKTKEELELELNMVRAKVKFLELGGDKLYAQKKEAEGL